MKWLLLVPALYLGVFALLVTFQEMFIFPFDPTHVSPRQAGEPRLTTHKLHTPDGEVLIIWAAAAKGRKPTLLYFHGNAGNLALRSQRFDRLLDRGFGVVAMGYRGSSGSSGKPSETTLNADALLLRNALPDLLGRAPKGLILYYGESLGTGIATKLAAEIPPDALLLEAPYTSLKMLAAKSLPIFPTGRFLRHNWDTLSEIKSLKMPLFILTGSDDDLIPFQHGQQIYAAASMKNKHLEILQGRGHTGLWDQKGQAAIYRFISRLP